MIQIKNITRYIVAYSLCILLFLACQDKYWDDHYSPNNEFNEKTLLQLVEGEPDLSKFNTMLKEAQMDSILMTSQSFTIWAPTNEALEAYTSSDKEMATQVVKNHIARFVYSPADLDGENAIRIKMLNNKYQNYTRRADGIYMANAKVISKTRIASNGVLQVVDNLFELNPSLWEIMIEGENTDSIAKYLTAFDEYIFDPVASTPIGTDELGQSIYDSVFIHRNKWLSLFGRIEKEDSVYMAIIPTNTAWNEAFTRINPYFRTIGEMLEETINQSTYITTREYLIGDEIADSLQFNHTRETIAQDLIFRQKSDNIPNDSLISSNGNVFYDPGYLFSDATYTNASNGWAYMTDKLLHKPKESWHKRIELEADQCLSRFRYATVVTRNVKEDGNYFHQVSGAKFLEISNTSTNPNMQPYAIFNIPNTLAAKYDIYCTFVPLESYEVGKADTTKVRFTLNYVHEDGKMHEDPVISKDPISGEVYTTNPRGMTKLLVAKGFKFPFANFTNSRFEEKTQRINVLLKVQTNVSNTETSKYNRILRIDRLILEPVNE